MCTYYNQNQPNGDFHLHKYKLREVIKNLYNIHINPKTIPKTETKLLCAVFLDAVIRFYEDPVNKENFRIWSAEKGDGVSEHKL